MAGESGMSPEQKKEKALRLIASQPQNFRWTIDNTTFNKDELVEKAESPEIIKLVLEAGLDLPRENELGRRVWCLVCGTEILCLKTIEGGVVVGCCGQDMIPKQPKPVPSSD